ncbi:MAG: hypothetical protein GWP60_00645 [Gammaproteobacteria bacterium]|jgi:hypothetical protein|nr:hypothetical protein [Gammaproteobacteria bacterium]
MSHRARLTAIRVLPLLLLTIAAGAWFNEVQQGGPYVLRNLLPPVVLLFFATLTVWRGDGNWTGRGWRWPLGLVGFAIPALGLSMYLHYAYSVNLNGMFDDAEQPTRVFRFLPAYTLVAGGIGFSIGWIVGRNV